MGYFAAATDGSDAFPAEDFHTPPAPQSERFTMTGTVTDSTGKPVAGAVVSVSGLGDQFSAVTDGTGEYFIPGMFAGTYPKVTADGAGYFGDVQSVTLPLAAPADFEITRDWAASSGGASLVDFTGPNFAPQCGPLGAIDLSLGTGWGSTVDAGDGKPSGTFIPKHIDVQLPQAVDISQVGVDPNATCGDPGSSSTGDYSIEVSQDGTTWLPGATGHFGIADRGHLNLVNITNGTGVRFVRFTIAGDQVVDVASASNPPVPGTFAQICGNPTTQNDFGGCQFADMSELAVFGSATP
jgi:hypothetical protein